jgi:two-component system, NarL family, vancomycin resistance associated response regulator VraR
MLMLSCEPSTVKVLVVDDHELTRLTLKLAIAHQENLELVGLASNGKEAVEMAQRFHPDAVVLDLQMPVMDGWSAAAKIKDLKPETQIIAYSSVEDPKLHDREAVAHFDAVCKKDIATPELMKLIEELNQQKEASRK